MGIFKSGGSSAPMPQVDPGIAENAKANTQLGQDWLNFAKDQFAQGNLRQEDYDKLINQVVQSDLATQQRAAEQSQTDRALGTAATVRYNELGNKAENYGQAYGDWLGGVAGEFGKTAATQEAFGQGQRDRYGNTFVPVENRIASEAMNWDTPEAQAAAAAAARGDVLSAAQAQQEARARQMAAQGVNPASGRYASVERAADINTALGAAGAQNQARDLVRQQGIQLRGQAAQLGQQVLGSGQQAAALGLQARQAQEGATQAAFGTKMAGLSGAQSALTSGLSGLGIGNQAAQLSLGAGGSAVGAGAAGNQNFYANQGIMGQGLSGAIGANQGAGQLLNQQYGSQLNAWNAQNQANAQKSQGLGGLLGTVGGLGLKAYSSGALGALGSGIAGLFSSKDFKTDKRPVHGALAAINGLPIEVWKYKPGIGDEGEHIGAYAEDFQKATGKGDGKMIPVVDAIGVTMKAMQELSQKVDDLEKMKEAA